MLIRLPDVAAISCKGTESKGHRWSQQQGRTGGNISRGDSSMQARDAPGNKGGAGHNPLCWHVCEGGGLDAGSPVPIAAHCWP